MTSNNQEELLLSRFKKIEELGEGSYGKVYKVYDKQRNEILALKKIKLTKNEEGIPSTTLREITLLRELSHKNIVHLQDLIYKYKERKLYLVFEYMDYDLKNFLSKQKNLQKNKIKNIFKEIVKAVDFCHENYIMHRDLKPQNILINKEGTSIKLADFGLARHFNVPFRQYSKEIVTLWYRAPEIIMGCQDYGIGVDIWSLGCIFVELFTKKPVFIGDCQVQQLFLIFNVLGTPNCQSWPGVDKIPDFSESFPKFEKIGLEGLLKVEHFCEDALDLLSQMLVLDPLKRITCRSILKHKFFK